jgi:phospholipid/cholesterol/gamma-HCH transport system substrate-binding protein
METRGATPSRIFLMGAFALSCVGLLLFLWVSFGGTLPLRAQGYRFSVLLPDSGTIQNQGDVRIAGVSVGKVVGVSLDGRYTKATIEMQNRYAPIRRDVHLFVRRKSLLGEVYLEMTPGLRGTPALPDNGTIPASQVSVTVGLDQILSTFDPRTRSDLQAWIQGWAQGVGGTAPAISDDTVRFSQTAAAANNLLGILYQQRDALSNLVHDTGTTFGTIGSENARVQQLITAGDVVFSTTAARDHELEATFHDLPPFLRGLQSTLAATQRLSVPGTPALTALQPAARLIAPTLNDALTFAPSLRSVAQALGPVLDAAPAGLRDARQVLNGTVPLIPQLRFFGRYLVPIIDYVYAYRREIVESWPKGAAATNGTLPDPGTGHMLHYLRAPAQVPIEAVGIAQHRQPYSRGDAYMSPGGIAGIIPGHGGLQDFDCRALANALTVPPVPGGEPSCLQQAPWTFEGKTADYPQLKPAP